MTARMTYAGRLSGEVASRVLLVVGTRVYNQGDICNPSHFGTVTAVKPSEWGTNYQITPDEDSCYTEPYWIGSGMFSPEYKGNGLTRLVTEEAYNEYRRTQLERLQAMLQK